MRGAANTTISILRGTETDEYDDVVDTDTPVATGVVASILNQGRRTYLPAEGAYRVVQSYSGRCGPEVDLQKGDRIKDERTGTIYLVVDLSDNTALGGVMPDRTFALSRTA